VAQHREDGSTPPWPWGVPPGLDERAARVASVEEVAVGRVGSHQAVTYVPHWPCGRRHSTAHGAPPEASHDDPDVFRPKAGSRRREAAPREIDRLRRAVHDEVMPAGEGRVEERRRSNRGGARRHRRVDARHGRRVDVAVHDVDRPPGDPRDQISVSEVGRTVARAYDRAGSDDRRRALTRADHGHRRIAVPVMAVCHGIRAAKAGLFSFDRIRRRACAEHHRADEDCSSGRVMHGSTVCPSASCRQRSAWVVNSAVARVAVADAGLEHLHGVGHAARARLGLLRLFDPRDVLAVVRRRERTERLFGGCAGGQRRI
jgi:hypothetical protein